MVERRVIWASTVAPSDVHAYLRAVQRTPLWTDWSMRHITTHRAGSTAVKIAVFARAAMLLAVALIRSRPDLVHLHAVDKSGSLSRGAILAWLSRVARVPVLFQVHATNLDAYLGRSPRVMRAVIEATLSRVDAVVVGDTAENPDWTELDVLYREVSQ